MRVALTSGIITITSLAVIVLAIITATLKLQPTIFPSILSNFSGRSFASLSSIIRSSLYTTNMTRVHGGELAKRGGVYFLSHGGPPTMFETASGPYKAWQRYGQAVKEAKPRGLIVVSAHWENPSHESGVLVNTNSSNPLVYDFYNFPKHFYTQTFESSGNQNMVEDVKKALLNAGIEVDGVDRGLDHGVWVPFKVAFDGRTDIPILQVSLPGDSSPVSCARLGKALLPLRDEGYGIMGTGQIVHNLGDYFKGRPTPYVQPFLSAVHTALISSKPLEATMTLFRHPLYKQAHPTPEHFLPLAVAVAATNDEDTFEEVFVSAEQLGWGMYKWK